MGFIKIRKWRTRGDLPFTLVRMCAAKKSHGFIGVSAICACTGAPEAGLSCFRSALAGEYNTVVCSASRSHDRIVQSCKQCQRRRKTRLRTCSATLEMQGQGSENVTPLVHKMPDF
jgi:hypothetical protein